MGKLIPQSVRGMTFYFLSVILLDFAAIEVECSFITHVILYFNLMMPVSAIIEIYDLCSSLTLIIFFGNMQDSVYLFFFFFSQVIAWFDCLALFVEFMICEIKNIFVLYRETGEYLTL